MGKWIREKQNKHIVFIACIHFLVSFFTDRLIFAYSLWDFSTQTAAFKTLLAWGSKAAFFMFLILFWKGIFWFMKKADRALVKYTCIYLVIMCVLLLLTWPGIWRMDEFGILFEARNTFPNFWQHYLTSVFYILALMLFPTPAGVILLQNICISLIVGWLLYKFQKVLLKGDKTRLIYALYIPFLFFPVLDSNLYPMRMSLYAYLELFLLAKLMFLSIEKKISKKEIIALAILSAVLINWRSEAIYYLVAIPVCFLVLCWKFTDKKVKIRFIILTVVSSLLIMIPQKAGEMLGEKMYDSNANNYELTSMLLPAVPLIESIYADAMFSSYYPKSEEEAKRNLENKNIDDFSKQVCRLYFMDKVIDVKKAAKAASEGRTGISLYWSDGEFVRDYTDAQYALFKKIYWQLVFEKPEVFLKERVETFVSSRDLLENTTELFTKADIPNYEKFRQLFCSKPLSNSLRTGVISILELRSIKAYEETLSVYPFVYSAIPSMLLEGIILLVLLFKRKWGYALLLASHMAKIPLIFLTAPSRLFMYYYPVYLTGYVLTAFLIIYYVKSSHTKEISKTISYLKRNGIKNTCNEILERLDKKNLEEIQKQAIGYEGNRYFFQESLKNQHIQYAKEGKFQKDLVFSILVPAYETNEKHLKEMIDSVLYQSAFAKVELIIADAGTTNGVELIVKEYQAKLKEAEKGEFPKICYIRLDENKGISENTNEALKLAKGDYIGLLDHDDVLLYDALFYVRQKLEEADYELIYTDEDKGDGELNRFFEPHFKPDFNLDYLLCNNYICHFLVMKAELMKKLKFRKEYDGAQDYDLVLRAAGELLKEKAGKNKIAHIRKVLYHWRCHESSTAANPESKRYAYEAGKRAVENFLITYMGMSEEEAIVSHTLHLGFYKVTYKQPVFQARPDIAAVCGRVIKAGKVINGPKWQMEDGELTLFKGLKAAYGGYMHRAEMMLEVDGMLEEAVCWNEKYQMLFKEIEKKGKPLSFQEKQDMAKKNGDVFLYLPDFKC